MKIRLGDFFPRLEMGWAQEEGRRCHKLGGMAIALQGAIAYADLAARNRDAAAVADGIDGITRAASELRGGLPEGKAMLGQIRRKAQDLLTFVAPYRYRKPLPPKTATFLSDQLRDMANHELAIEGMTLKACGGRLSMPHQEAEKEAKRLKAIPAKAIKEAKELKAKLDRIQTERAERRHRAFMGRIARARLRRQGQ